MKALGPPADLFPMIVFNPDVCTPASVVDECLLMLQQVGTPTRSLRDMDRELSRLLASPDDLLSTLGDAIVERATQQLRDAGFDHSQVERVLPPTVQRYVDYVRYLLAALEFDMRAFPDGVVFVLSADYEGIEGLPGTSNDRIFRVAACADEMFHSEEVLQHTLALLDRASE
jgi:hypothetical protein